MPVQIGRRSLAVSLVVGLFLLTSSGPLFASSAATLTGRVVAAGGIDARSGVVVALVDTGAEKIYRSTPTDARGTFSVSAPTAGSYALVVEAPEGAFLASDGLMLAPGANRPVSLALKPGKQGTAPPAQPAGGTPPAKKAGLPTWAKWVIAGGIVVGAAIIVDAVTKNDKEASSFNK
jgi:carboxypeptidase family protein